MAEQQKTYVRFPVSQRLEHIVMVTSFITLALTGLPQKFADTGVATAILGALGGIETTRLIHHAAAVTLMVVTVYHLIAVGYRVVVKRVQMSMLPTLQDVRDALQAFGYNLGLRKLRPQMGRFTFEEKMEYWALAWGVTVMAITGFMMWNPIATTRLLPGEFIPAAKYAHGGEAILAVLAILIWHMYQVHIVRFNKSMFTGKLTEQEMAHEHPLELAQVKAGLGERPVPADVLRRRRRVFFPVAGVTAIVLLAGVYSFVTFEQTAITTLPARQDVPVIVIQTPTPRPSPTPWPSATAPAEGTPIVDLRWNGYVGSLFSQHCVACHGESGGLSLATYADVIKGGQNGTVVSPGSAEASPLVAKLQSGEHLGRLTEVELAQVIEWINQGAPE